MYDLLLTLPEEVALVWNKKWSVLDAAYLLNRLLAFVDVSMLLLREYSLCTYWCITSCTLHQFNSKTHPAKRLATHISISIFVGHRSPILLTANHNLLKSDQVFIGVNVADSRAYFSILAVLTELDASHLDP